MVTASGDAVSEYAPRVGDLLTCGSAVVHVASVGELRTDAFSVWDVTDNEGREWRIPFGLQGWRLVARGAFTADQWQAAREEHAARVPERSEVERLRAEVVKLRKWKKKRRAKT